MQPIVVQTWPGSRKRGGSCESSADHGPERSPQLLPSGGRWGNPGIRKQTGPIKMMPDLPPLPFFHLNQTQMSPSGPALLTHLITSPDSCLATFLGRLKLCNRCKHYTLIAFLYQQHRRPTVSYIILSKLAGPVSSRFFLQPASHYCSDQY